MRYEIGITAAHCGQNCVEGCAVYAVQAINRDPKCQRLEIVAYLGDKGPWGLPGVEHDAVEAAMDNADHRCVA